MTFKKGQSGNPSGRPKLDRDLVLRAKKAVGDHVIDRWIKEVVEEGPHWVRCSENLAAYGLGKPAQRHVIAGDKDNPVQITTYELPDNGRAVKQVEGRIIEASLDDEEDESGD